MWKVFGIWKSDNKSVIINCHFPNFPIKSPITSVSSSSFCRLSVSGKVKTVPPPEAVGEAGMRLEFEFFIITENKKKIHVCN